MDLLELTREIDSLSIKEVQLRAKSLTNDIIVGLKEIYLKTKIFEKYDSDPYELFFNLCYLCIDSNNKINEKEYELFNEVIEGTGKKFSPSELKKAIQGINFDNIIKLVDDIIDYIGVKNEELKIKFVEFALCFTAIDGLITDDEMAFINRLAR